MGQVSGAEGGGTGAKEGNGRRGTCSTRLRNCSGLQRTYSSMLSLRCWTVALLGRGCSAAEDVADDDDGVAPDARGGGWPRRALCAARCAFQ